MNLENQFLFFFSALGAFNSSILSVYFLFFTKSKNISNYFLGGLLTVLSIRIWKSLFFYFNHNLSKNYLQIGLTACFFIGPFLYFFIKSKQKKEIHWKAHLGILFGIISIIGFLFPYKLHVEFWSKYLYKIINYQWLIYMIISTFLLKNSLKKLTKKSEKCTKNEIWMLSIYFGIFLIWAAYFTSSYTSYISGALSFSFAFYITILLFFINKNKEKQSIQAKEKYVNSKITKEEAIQILSQINLHLKEKELYKNSNLTLTILAKELKIRPHLISQVLNENLQKNFPQFINEFRIQEAIKLLKTENHLKMEIIAENCGFNSNSTFYSAFKKVTGTTPAKYAKIPVS
ncbi:helix-turn-helix domain-containing protein [Aureivirga marina]|uniref:helix-turn-helix domain-containing protein n=1 Tax=Aureivirga marina TaxID=1182451 RepID=UPI0018C90389|nr:helix-turn-helix transcriptional regulator [Aureivirga marina]